MLSGTKKLNYSNAGLVPRGRPTAAREQGVCVLCPPPGYMSGLYQHNTRCLANSVGAGCDGPSARAWEAGAMAVHLLRAGYLTG